MCSVSSVPAIRQRNVEEHLRLWLLLRVNLFNPPMLRLFVSSVTRGHALRGNFRF
jgi:hypothetical protein